MRAFHVFKWFIGSAATSTAMFCGCAALYPAHLIASVAVGVWAGLFGCVAVFGGGNRLMDVSLYGWEKFYPPEMCSSCKAYKAQLEAVRSDRDELRFALTELKTP